MKSRFRSYPNHPWIAEWTLEPSGYSSTYRENCLDHFFRTRPTVGQLIPDVERPAWALQVPVPQNSRTVVLANGFCAYLEQRKFKCGAEVLCPEPGVLWGRFWEIPTPVLLADQPSAPIGEGQWIETDTLNAYLEVRENTFCLVSKSTVPEDARKVAADYFQQDFERELDAEYDRRGGIAELFEGMTHHDSLAAICAESMIRALRPPEGHIPHIWSQSSSTDKPRFDINEVFPLAQAWCLIDPDIAEELLLCALKIQTNAGALPVHYSPHTTYSVMEAPKPMLAKTVQAVWEARRNPEFLKTAVPILRRHVQWMLHHFDPKRRGIYSWKNKNEPFVPGLFQSDLVSVDLAALLLTEIEALNALREEVPEWASSPPFFEEERTNLQQSLANQFWNESDKAFTHAYIRDSQTVLRGLPALVPLLWNGLPQHQRAGVLDHINHSETIPGSHNVLSWKQSSLDDSEFPLLQQFLVFHALKTAAPQSTLLSDFSRLTIQGFLDWHTVAMDTNASLHIHSATGAYILSVQAMHRYRYYGKGVVTGSLFRLLRKVRADRTDLFMIAAMLLIWFCVHTLYEVREEPVPLTALTNQMNSAYADKDANATISICKTIITTYPEHREADRARLLAANTMLLSGSHEMAGLYYAELREVYPDSPAAMIGMGLALQLQGRLDEAARNYDEFCYLFDVIFPNAVKKVNEFRFVMREGLPKPPKWQEIYRYPFMHELE